MIQIISQLSNENRTEHEETGIKQKTVRLHQEEVAIDKKETGIKQDDIRVKQKLVDIQQGLTHLR